MSYSKHRLIGLTKSIANMAEPIFVVANGTQNGFIFRYETLSASTASLKTCSHIQKFLISVHNQLTHSKVSFWQPYWQVNKDTAAWQSCRQKLERSICWSYHVSDKPHTILLKTIQVWLFLPNYQLIQCPVVAQPRESKGQHQASQNIYLHSSHCRPNEHTTLGFIQLLHGFFSESAICKSLLSCSKHVQHELVHAPCKLCCHPAISWKWLYFTCNSLEETTSIIFKELDALQSLTF